MYIKAFPDLHFTVDDLIAEGDRVAVRVTAQGTFRGELAGVSPTGQSASVPCLMITRLEDGKIVDEFEVWDQLTMFQDLGALTAVVAHA